MFTTIIKKIKSLLKKQNGIEPTELDKTINDAEKMINNTFKASDALKIVNDSRAEI